MLSGGRDGDMKMFLGPKLTIPLLCAGLALLVQPALAQQKSQTLKGAADAIKAAGAVDDLDPDAVTALKAMGQYIATQKTIDLTTHFEAELDLDNGQTVEIGGSAHYLAAPPDKLRVELKSDLGQRSFLFNGQSLYVVAPDQAVYGQLDNVGPTIKDMLDQVGTYSDIELPLADLFNWGTADDPAALIGDGFRVGAATVDGQPTTHWAYRTADKDFEVWIADGAKPLPLKLVVIDAISPDRPRFEVNLDWSDNPVIAAAAFDFTPPTGTDEVPILIHDAARETSK